MAPSSVFVLVDVPVAATVVTGDLDGTLSELERHGEEMAAVVAMWHAIVRRIVVEGCIQRGRVGM
jgi:hypothetical protein